MGIEPHHDIGMTRVGPNLLNRVAYRQERIDREALTSRDMYTFERECEVERQLPYKVE